MSKVCLAGVVAVSVAIASAEPKLSDNPEVPGWLVERQFHAEPIECPWPKNGAACDARVTRITALRDKLSTCKSPLSRTDRAIGHRGAPLVAPEETVASWEIAASSGAGWLECDASISKDLEFVCRHNTCDLAYTTDIVTEHPRLHAKCSKPWVPGSGKPAVCCTYDFTLDELSSLCAIMESEVKPSAKTQKDYIEGPPGFRSGAIAKEECHRIATYQEYLKLLKKSHYKAIPELKDTMKPELVAFMARQGKSIDWLADKFARELTGSFKLGDAIAQTLDQSVAKHWKKSWPKMKVSYLFTKLPCSAGTGSKCSNKEVVSFLRDLNVDMVSPPTNLLLAKGPDGTIVPSQAAEVLQEVDLPISPWVIERQGCTVPSSREIQPAALAPCGRKTSSGGGYYDTVEGTSTFQHVDVLEVLDALFEKVGIVSLFSDWPATVAAYANCVLKKA